MIDKPKNRRVSKTWEKLLKLLPGYDPFAHAEGCWFDEKIAQKAIDFFHECLTHVEGELARKPFLLEPWQKSILANLFGWQYSDRKGRHVRRYREMLLYVPRKNGKALALDTPIPTPGGWKMMGDLVPGDVVFDDNGLPTNVVQAFDVMHDHDCFRVEFSDKTSIVADADHLWTTKSRNPENITATRTTREIAETLTVGNRSTHCERNHSISVAGPLSIEARDLPIDPYVLGAWLGDGHSDSARITYSAEDTDVPAELEAAGVVLTSPYADRRGSHAISAGLAFADTGTCRRGHDLSHRSARGRCLLCERQHAKLKHTGTAVDPIVNITLQETLRGMDLLGNKHIPAAYLRASVSQRMSLIQGLMDTDGYCSKRGQCEFTTTKTALRDGFVELARSLGYKPSIKTARATIEGRDCGEKYRIQFFAYADAPVFRMKRKAARLKPRPASPRRSSSRQIVAVEPVASVPVRCIQVDSPSRLYLAGEGMVPTHNTPMCAGLCNYLLFCDGEAGAQIYSAAAEREQAALLFRHAKGMVEQEPELDSRAKIYGGIGQRSIVLKEDQASVYKVLSADADTKHGGNSHAVIIDELHAQPNRDLVDVLQTSLASENRIQPLIVHITTADFDRPSICNEKYAYACSVRDNKGDKSQPGYDPGFLPVIYEALQTEDWRDPKVWAKANPNLGVSVSLAYLERECRKAEEISAYENTFKRLHLNMRTQQDVRLIPMAQWDAGSKPFDERGLEGSECFAGLDLASTTDIAAFVMVFPDGGGGYHVIPRLYVPAENARQRARRDRVPYEQWISDGKLVATEGNVIDYDRIRADINELGQRYNIKGIARDRWNATQITNQLMGDGFEVTDFGQGFASMTAPTKELVKLVAAGRLYHGGHPVLRWMAGNCAGETDAAGNLKLSKKKSSEKIDGMVALVMGLGLATSSVEADSPQVFFV